MSRSSSARIRTQNGATSLVQASCSRAARWGRGHEIRHITAPRQRGKQRGQVEPGGVGPHMHQPRPVVGTAALISQRLHRRLRLPPGRDGEPHRQQAVLVPQGKQSHRTQHTPSAAAMTALIALTQADTVLLWDPSGRTLIAANVIGTMPWTESATPTRGVSR
jgi:hypothetical protein